MKERKKERQTDKTNLRDPLLLHQILLLGRDGPLALFGAEGCRRRFARRGGGGGGGGGFSVLLGDALRHFVLFRCRRGSGGDWGLGVGDAGCEGFRRMDVNLCVWCASVV